MARWGLVIGAPFGSFRGMSMFETMACILLAAGEARRFGGGKLTARLADEPVGLHAARMLAAMPFARNVAICRRDGPDFAAVGFEAKVIGGEPALSASIAAGMEAVADCGAEAVLIALADMPLVPAAHVGALVTAFDGDRIATVLAGGPQPPAIFGKAHFAALSTLQGDRGARPLLTGAAIVPLDPAYAIDIDTPADLRQAERMLAGRAESG